MRKAMISATAVSALLFALSLVPAARAQESITVLAGAELARVVPPGFYFQGLSAPTQLRNSAAARFGEKHHVVVAMVDTSGYAADIRAKYEGFFITDLPLKINGSDLKVGAYGFGFSDDGKFHILDLANKEILSTNTTKDNSLKRPRPLMMVKSNEGLRLYSGRDYIVITAR